MEKRANNSTSNTKASSSSYAFLLVYGIQHRYLLFIICFIKIKCSFSMHRFLYSFTKHSKLSKYAHTHTHMCIHSHILQMEKKNKHASTENEKDEEEEEETPYMQICVSRQSQCVHKTDFIFRCTEKFQIVENTPFAYTHGYCIACVFTHMTAF